MSIAAQERIAELEQNLAASKAEQANLVKKLAEVEKKTIDEEKHQHSQEQSFADLTVDVEKGRKIIRTLLHKQSQLEDELKVLKEQPKNGVS